jgi:hypothetical protein
MVDANDGLGPTRKRRRNQRPEQLEYPRAIVDLRLSKRVVSRTTMKLFAKVASLMD